MLLVVLICNIVIFVRSIPVFVFNRDFHVKPSEIGIGSQYFVAEFHAEQVFRFHNFYRGLLGIVVNFVDSELDIRLNAYNVRVVQLIRKERKRQSFHSRISDVDIYDALELNVLYRHGSFRIVCRREVFKHACND